MSFAVLASLSAPSAYRIPQLHTSSCIFLSLSSHPWHNLREDTSRCSLQEGHLFHVWDGFLPSFPPLAEQATGATSAGFPRATFTWRLWSKYPGHPLSSASKVKKLERFEGLENSFNFWRRKLASPHLLCAWHGPEQRKPFWAEVAGLITPHHLLQQKDSLSLDYLWLLLLKQPQLHLPWLAGRMLSHGSAHPSPLHICR